MTTTIAVTQKMEIKIDFILNAYIIKIQANIVLSCHTNTNLMHSMVIFNGTLRSERKERKNLLFYGI